MNSSEEEEVVESLLKRIAASAFKLLIIMNTPDRLANNDVLNLPAPAS